MFARAACKWQDTWLAVPTSRAAQCVLPLPPLPLRMAPHGLSHRHSVTPHSLCTWRSVYPKQPVFKSWGKAEQLVALVLQRHSGLSATRCIQQTWLTEQSDKCHVCCSFRSQQQLMRPRLKHYLHSPQHCAHLGASAAISARNALTSSRLESCCLASCSRGSS